MSKNMDDLVRDLLHGVDKAQADLKALRLHHVELQKRHAELREAVLEWHRALRATLSDPDYESTFSMEPNGDQVNITNIRLRDLLFRETEDGDGRES